VHAEPRSLAAAEIASTSALREDPPAAAVVGVLDPDERRRREVDVPGWIASTTSAAEKTPSLPIAWASTPESAAGAPPS